MSLQNTKSLISSGAMLLAVAATPACSPAAGDAGLYTTQQAVYYVGRNDLNPGAVDTQVLRRSVTNQYGITTSSVADPMSLCAPGATSTSCTVNAAWESWRTDSNLSASDRGYRESMLQALVKCAMPTGFTLYYGGGASSQVGYFGLYPSWQAGPLAGQDKHERISACALSLLNGNNVSLALCIIGPGGSPFSDDCGDASMTVREGGYFGDLFAANPTAYVVGPNTAPQVTDGRACFANQGTYCCAEDDSSCPHHIVLAGGFAAGTNQRCTATATTSTGRQYCTSFYSTREPGRTYNAGFTTFIPPAN
jgi:hypothetical protein